ncbi:PQQ-binding-like beta-propeller repeat protein [Microtetraspora malaysiensis]|uniref:outer membrane protein assembly factor BamB family protein n=1 Tax=Microtetraspora malaysiensis TaxID=161358 RepID=UPI003D903259
MSKPSSREAVEWPVEFAGPLPIFVDGWLIGTGDDENGVVWLRDAETGRLLWSRPVGPVSSYPDLAVSAGRVFAAVWLSSASGEASELHTLCAADGRPLWRRPLPGDHVVEIKLVGETLVVATLTSVYGVSARTGGVRWRIGVAARFMATVGDILIATRSSGPSGVIGLYPETGRVLWELPLPETSSVEFTADQDLIQVRAYEFPDGHDSEGLANPLAASLGGEIYAVPASTGHILWKRAFASMGSAAFSAQGMVYLTAEGRLVALDVGTGKTVWSRSLPSPDLSPDFRLNDGALLVNVNGPDRDGKYPIWGLAPRSGAEKWALRLSQGVYEIALAPSGMAFMVTISQSAKLIAVDTNDGGEIWSRPVNKDSQILLGRDLVYLGGGMRQSIDAFRMRDGVALSD